MRIDEVLRILKAAQCGDNAWKAHCPAHPDNNASLSITAKHDKLLLHCHAGCSFSSVCAAAGLEPKDLFFGEPPAQAGKLPFKYGLTLAEYAEGKNFSVELLQRWGVADGMYETKSGRRHPGVMIPYMDREGKTPATRWRMRLAKEQGSEPSRFLWARGSQLCLYGLWHLELEEKTVLLVEGESDCHALWHAGVNALGMPGAANWRAERDEQYVEFFDKIYVHIELDKGGQTVFESFVGNPRKNRKPSALLHKILFFSLSGYKDPSDAWEKLHHKPEEFSRLLSAGIRGAQPANLFQQPECWEESEPDGRSRTSAVNGAKGAAHGAKGAAHGAKGAAHGAKGAAHGAKGAAHGVKGGRPAADYIGLAKAYRDLFLDAEGQLHLRHWRNNWYAYNGRCFRPRLDVDIESQAVAWLQDTAVAERYHVQPSSNALRNLLLGLRSAACCGIAAETEAPSWLPDGQSADGWIAMSNTLLNLEEAARAHHQAGGSGADIEPQAMQAYTRPLSPALLSTFALDYAYQPGADCPNFRAWLESTQPDPEVRSAMLMLMGLALVPDTSYNVCFFLSGDGGTGKSTFLDILQALVGAENCCRVPLLKFEDRFSTWPLAESLLNIVGEMPTDDPQGKLRYIEGDFKDSISGGIITIERKGKDICTARCTARHVFATNSLPIFFDKSEGIWDRLIIIPFDQRFRGAAGEIRNIKDTIIPQELPGILNLALWSLAELRRHTRFPEPVRCSDHKRHHRDRCDFDAAYLNEHYRLAEGAETRVAQAYEHYRAALLSNGLAPRSSPTFQAAVARVHGVRASRRSSIDRERVFKGLAMTQGGFDFDGATKDF
ncbi:MAG: phage/plasmid primase, P4 family [Lentisphaeria bacterium]|nr:phage/plasmid primase, P4 family [Lentisphaeria bacterium]